MSVKLGVSHSPVSAVSTGQVVVQGDLVGIAAGDIAAGESGHIFLLGVFNIAKAIGATTAITAGSLVYWDDINKVGTASDGAGANKLMGKSVRASADGDRHVRVILTP